MRKYLRKTIQENRTRLYTLLYFTPPTLFLIASLTLWGMTIRHWYNSKAIEFDAYLTFPIIATILVLALPTYQQARFLYGSKGRQAKDRTLKIVEILRSTGVIGPSSTLNKQAHATTILLRMKYHGEATLIKKAIRFFTPAIPLASAILADAHQWKHSAYIALASAPIFIYLYGTIIRESTLESASIAAELISKVATGEEIEHQSSCCNRPADHEPQGLSAQTPCTDVFDEVSQTKGNNGSSQSSVELGPEASGV